MSKITKVSIVACIILLFGSVYLFRTLLFTSPATVVTKDPTIQLPENFPVYTAATYVISDTKNPKKPMYTWKTNDPVTAVTKWYIDALEKDGWQITVRPSNQNALKDTVENLEARKKGTILQLSVLKQGATQITAEFPDPSLFEEDEEE